jgi:hypothetical protein
MGLNRGQPARQSSDPQVQFIRFAINWNDVGVATGALKATLPSGAILIGTDHYVETAFNAVTTNVVTVGTNASTYNNILAAADITEGTTGALVKDTSPTGTALGPLTADTAVYALYTQTGTAATAGKCHIMIKYICNINT